MVTMDELPVKRLHLEGVEATSPCPHCGEAVDVTDPPLSYPPVGIPFDINMYHYHDADGVESEWTVRAQLHIGLELLGAEPRAERDEA